MMKLGLDTERFVPELGAELKHGAGWDQGDKVRGP